MVKIGNYTVGKNALIIGIITEQLAPEELNKLPEAVQVLELRVDSMLANMTLEDIESYLKQLKDLERFAVLLTVRLEGPVNMQLKQEVMDRFLKLSDAVDVEIECHLREDLIKKAKSHGKTVIVSFHDFDSTPQYQQLRHIVREAESIGADIIKIAVTARAETDLFDLYQFMDDNRDSNLIGISMGQYGKSSRVKAFEHGSLATYAPLTKANAPGQMTVEEMVSQLSVNSDQSSVEK